MRAIYRARNAATAELARQMLEDGGIRATVLGLPLQAAIGDIPFVNAYPEVCVVEQDVQRALQLLSQCGIEPPEPKNCPECGYDLRGLPQPRCPECGTVFPRRSASVGWVCRGCGESSEGQFTACWRCGMQRDEA